MASNLEERLKSTLWYNVGKTVDSETINLGVNATQQFIGSLTELVWTQIENAALDLESFATHGKRNTIQTEDVLLLARRNEGLQSVLKDFLAKLEEKKRSKKSGNEEDGEVLDSGEGEEEESPGVGKRKKKTKTKTKVGATGTDGAKRKARA